VHKQDQNSINLTLKLLPKAAKSHKKIMPKLSSLATNKTKIAVK
jgi:hypothetical protein